MNELMQPELYRKQQNIASLGNYLMGRIHTEYFVELFMGYRMLL